MSSLLPSPVDRSQQQQDEEGVQYCQVRVDWLQGLREGAGAIISQDLGWFKNDLNMHGSLLRVSYQVIDAEFAQVLLACVTVGQSRKKPFLKTF